MKKLMLVVILVMLVLMLSGCNVTLIDDLVTGYSVRIDCTQAEIEKSWGIDEGASKEDVKQFIEQEIKEASESSAMELSQIKLSRIQKNGKKYSIFLEIEQSKDIYQAFVQGFAYGQADEMFKIYLEDRYKSDDFQKNLDDLKLEAITGNMHIVGPKGNTFMGANLSATLNKFLEESKDNSDYKAVFVNSNDVSKYVLPGNTVLILTQNTILDPILEVPENRFNDATHLEYKSQKVKSSYTGTEIENPSYVLVITHERFGRIGTIGYVIAAIIILLAFGGVISGISRRRRYSRY